MDEAGDGVVHVRLMVFALVSFFVLIPCLLGYYFRWLSFFGLVLVDIGLIGFGVFLFVHFLICNYRGNNDGDK